MTGAPRPARRQRRRPAPVEPARFIAHDANNLLTAIAGAAELILARGTDPATIAPATLDDIRAIREAAERCASLVGLLLTPGSRAEASLSQGSQSPPAPCPILLNPAIARLAPLLRHVLGSRVRLELTLEEPGPAARIDKLGLDRVLINLAVNARHAMPDGGTLHLTSRAVTRAAPRRQGTETLRQGEETIPHTLPPGQFARIEVADNGCGIPRELLPRIFAPRVTARRGGSGLGLAAVRGIIRRAGGWIAVESTPGSGTRFRIDLPISAGDAAPAASPAASAPSAGPATVSSPISSGPRALLVEDEAAVGRVALLALRKAGWEVHLAESAESVLANLDRLARPDVLVSDIALTSTDGAGMDGAGMDGTGLVRRLRQRWPGLPAILVSGYVDEEARRGLEAEGMRFLPKPYSLASLLSAMAAAAGLLAAPIS